MPGPPQTIEASCNWGATGNKEFLPHNFTNRVSANAWLQSQWCGWDL